MPKIQSSLSNGFDRLSIAFARRGLPSRATHDVHEFFIMRKFRRCGWGQSMATFLCEHPGEWLVRVIEANALAIPFWRTAISRYSLGSYREEQNVVHGELLPWRSALHARHAFALFLRRPFQRVGTLRTIVKQASPQKSPHSSFE